MPNALSHNPPISDRSGGVNDGRPGGMGPTRATPLSPRFKSAEARMPKATATNGAERRGYRRGSRIRMARVISEIRKVSQ